MTAALPRRIFAALWRRKWWALGASVAVGFSLTPIIILTRTYAIIHPNAHPTTTPGAPVLEVQTESFTCGLHALNTVYRAYGLDPAAERLRWRLGVDTKALFWMPDSTGSLHPDIAMVLAQDFFTVTALDVDAADAWNTWRAHLATGHPALVLFARRQTGNLHWVVSTGISGDQIELYDSLAPTPYREGEDFLRERVVSVWLVRPSSDGRMAMSSFQAHAMGARATARAATRIKHLPAARP